MTTVDPRVEDDDVSATGGSARSQLYDLADRSWKPRRRISLLIVCVSFAIPVICSLVVVQLAARAVHRPAGAAGLLAWILAMVAVATASLWSVDRFSRRLLPLAAMLRLSLVFPDRAPSRFAVTLKTGSGKALERALQRSRTNEEFATSEQSATLVVGLIAAVLAHDRLTRGHCERVRAYADLIGEELGLDADARNKLHWAALLHDVGKLDVPARVLNKTDKLSAEEWQTIRGHPGASGHWIDPLRGWLGDWVLAASEHHERYDGDGYPRGLRGDDISLAGRIVAVADAFDVMTAARSYKKPFPAAQARVELANNAGTQFDPKVVRAFLAISLGRLKLVMGPLAWLSGVSGSFSVGSITSAATAAGTAILVAATAFAAPAGAGATGLAARTAAAQSGARNGSSSADFVGSGVGGAGGPAGPSGSRSRTGGGSGTGGGTTATVPVTPIGPATGTGSSEPGGSGTGGTGSGGSGTGGTGTGGSGSRTPRRGSSGDGSTPSTTPSTSGGSGTGSTTPTTDPGAPGTTPTTTPGSPPATTPVTTPGAPLTTVPAATPHAPVANNDVTGTLLVANVAINVLANDTDADGNLDPSTLSIVHYPSGGYLSITAVNGQIDVHVAPLYTGTLVFTYQVCDTTNLCAQATVTAKFALSLL